MPANPSFSIIIPTYNRPDQLEDCLRSITELQYPTEYFEVLVVDDGSTVDLRDIVDSFQDILDIQLLRKKNEGPASARNFGAARARGTYLAFTDDDCRPDPDWLNTMAEQIALTPDRLLGGKTVNLLENNPFSSASQLIVDIVYEHYNADPDEARFFASNNMVVPSRLFREVGGFAAGWRTSEDRELCDRWLMRGYKMSYVENAVIYHSHELSFLGFCKQHFHYGKGAYHFHRTRKKRKSGTMVQEMDFHTNLRNWLLAPFYRKEKRPLTLFVLLMVWQVANLVGFIWAGCFERKRL